MTQRNTSSQMLQTTASVPASLRALVAAGLVLVLTTVQPGAGLGFVYVPPPNPGRKDLDPAPEKARGFCFWRPGFHPGTRSMRSDAIKQGPARAPARAMLRATGLDDAAIARPLGEIGRASCRERVWQYV